MRGTASVGLLILLPLVVACSVLGYHADSVSNDTVDRFALCIGTSLKPEALTVAPGEVRKVHSGVDCSVFSSTGQYAACLRLPDSPSGRIILVSAADERMAPADCPNSSISPF
jgi:hypothetical protein